MVKCLLIAYFISNISAKKISKSIHVRQSYSKPKVGRFLRHSVVSPTKTAEPIEMPFEMRTRVGQGNHVLGEGALRHHLTNTSELPMCGGDAACCQITLTTCYYY